MTIGSDQLDAWGRTLCSAEGCGRPSRSGGMCNKHYEQKRRASKPPCAAEDCDKRAATGEFCRRHHAQALAADTPCTIPGCDSNDLASRGMCARHYRAFNRYGDPLADHTQVRGECAIPGCDNPHHALGYCARHWMRMSRNGSPTEGASDIHATPEEAFDARTERRGDCLVWTGATNQLGYGRLRTGRRYIQAHRWAYEQKYGPIPDGLVIDHTCWTPGCVRADHLRAISQADNTAYRSGPNSNSTTGARNVYVVNGKYLVEVTQGDKKYTAGRFTDIEDAKRAAGALRARIFGDYAGRG